MQYSKKQISRALNKAGRNIGKAIVCDGGTVFINDVSLEPVGYSYTAKLTFRGNPVDLSEDKENLKRATDVLFRAYNMDARRKQVRNFFQKLSDRLTHNYNLESMKNDEIWAWFAMDKINKNKNKLRISRVGYMYKIMLGNIEFSHLPSEKGKQVFFVIQDKKFVEITNKGNKQLYERALDLFFDIYDKRINGRFL